MAFFHELVMLALSFGALNNFKNSDDGPSSNFEESLAVPESNYESKSLYDLMANFPTDEASQFNCPENEEYKKCGTACYKTCHNYDEDTDIPCPYNCLSGCFCKDPLVRGIDGKCIYKEDCLELNKLNDTSTWFPDKKCPRNEVYTCGAHCQKRCEKSWWPCPGWCVPGCECMSPLVRGPAGNCIFREDCPKTLTAPESTKFEECAPDEEMSCYSHCQKNCTNYDQDIKCPIYCVRGCVCKLPMIKGPNGNCILPEQCPSIQNFLQESEKDCAVNEIYDPCGSGCEDNCTSLNTPFCPNTECVAGCFCQPYHVRSFDGRCVLPFECIIRATEPSDQDDSTPSSNINDLGMFVRDEDDPDIDGPEDCAVNEIYDHCGSGCEDNCTSENIPFCFNTECVAGCFCKPYYVRRFDGRCVQPFECMILATEPSDQDDSNPSSNINDLGIFVRDEDGTDTGSQYNCHVNEEYKECGTACQLNCDNYYKELYCPNHCIAGCFCKDPMVRAPNGTCVYKEECSEREMTLRITKLILILSGGHAIKGRGFLPDFPKIRCKENEEFALCASICPDTCYNYDTERTCKHICDPGCRCKSGYVIGSDGVCTKKENCKEQTHDDCAENEYFDDCGPRCEKDCYNIPLSECEDKSCKKGCFCKPGLVRISGDGKCIKPIDCI